MSYRPSENGSRDRTRIHLSSSSARRAADSHPLEAGQCCTCGSAAGSDNILIFRANHGDLRTATKEESMGASLFAGVELAPRDPILGLTEAFNARRAAAQGQPRRRRLPERRREDPGAARRGGGRAPARRTAAAARLPADRRHPRVRPRRPATAVRRGLAADQGRQGDHRAGARRHRRPEGRRRPAAPRAARLAGRDQRPELGEPPRDLRVRRVRGHHLPVLRRRHARAELRRDDRRPEGAAAEDRSSCCTPAATTRPAST